MKKKTYVRPETQSFQVEATQHLLAASGPNLGIDDDIMLDDEDEQY